MHEDSSDHDIPTPEVTVQLWEGRVAPNQRIDATIRRETGSAAGPESELSRRHVVSRNAGQPSGRKLTDFELLDILGTGGMGLVYNAHQVSTDRVIALKVMRPGNEADARKREQFVREARLTGDLDHPNIVPVHDMGADDSGTPFYAMKRVQGRSWQDIIKDASQAENLSILLRVCDAVAFAHARGVIHRDLKPENVMVGDFGEVLLMDWGVAVQASPTSGNPKAPPLTEANGGTGTAAYMSPEMARCDLKQIGPRSDVYLLGGILYEIVTGLTPHAGEDIYACLLHAARNVVQRSPVQGELVDIARQAMASAPEDRYASAKDFQAAIRAAQTHAESALLSDRASRELSEARETGTYETYAQALFGFRQALDLWPDNDLAKQGERDAVLAYAGAAERRGDLDLAASLLDATCAEHAPLIRRITAAQKDRDLRRRRLRNLRVASGTLAALVFVTMSVAIMWIRAEQSRANRERALAVEAKNEADHERRVAELAREAAEVERQRALAASEEAEKERVRAVASREKAERENYRSSLALADTKILNGQCGQARELLWRLPRRFRHWEWGRSLLMADTSLATLETGLMNASVPHPLSPGGKHVVTFRGSNVCLVDVNTGETVRTMRCAGNIGWPGRARFSRDGTRVLALTTHGRAHRTVCVVLDTDTGQTTPTGTVEGEIVGFSAAGDRAAFRSKSALSVLEVMSGSEVWRAGVRVGAVAFSPDGDAVAGSGATRDRLSVVTVWDLDAGKSVDIETGHTEGIRSMAFSPDGRRLLTSDRKGGTVRLWDWQRQTELLSFDQIAENAEVLAVGPDGRRFVTGGRSSGGPCAIWNAETGNLLCTLKEGKGGIRAAAFSPDGSRVATGGGDRAVRLWRVADGQQLLAWEGHAGAVEALVFSPSGAEIASACHDGAVKVWDSHTGEIVLNDPNFDTRWLAYAENGKRLLGCREQTPLRASFEQWDTATGNALNKTEFLLGDLADFTDGYVLSRPSSQAVEVVDPKTGRQLHQVAGDGACVARFSPDGERFVTGAEDGTVWVWDTATGRRLLRLKGHSNAVDYAAFSGHHKALATRSEKHVSLWNLDNGQLVSQLPVIGEDVRCITFSPDDKRLVTGEESGTLRVWSADTGERLAYLRGHTAGVRCAVFSPDNLRIASSGDDGVARTWNAETGAPLLVLRGHPRGPGRPTYTPDGRRILTQAADVPHQHPMPIWRIWDAHRDLASRAVPSNAGVAVTLQFTPNSQRLLAGGFQAMLLLDPLPPRTVRRIDVNPNSYAPASLSADGRRILTLRHAEGVAPVYDAETAEVVNVLKDDTPIVGRPVFAPVGERAATRGHDERVTVWDTAAGKPLRVLRPAGKVRRLFFSPDATLLAIALTDRTLLWNWQTERDPTRLPAINTGWPSSKTLVFMPDARGILFARRNKAFLYDPDTARQLAAFEGHSARVQSVDVSADGRRAVTGSADSSIKVWDTRSGKELCMLNGHTKGVVCVAFSPDNRRIASASTDLTLRIWNAAPYDIDPKEYEQWRTARYQRWLAERGTQTDKHE